MYNVVILLCTIYRPPNVRVDWWSDFEFMLNGVKDVFNGFIILTGDFNSDLKTVNGTRLLNLASSFNLNLHIEESTHAYNDTVLDQFVTNCSTYITKIEISDPICNNDHCTIGIWFNFKTPKQKSFKRIMWNFNNIENYKMALENCNFDFCDEILDINLTVEKWSNLIFDLALEHIPHKLVTV